MTTDVNYMDNVKKLKVIASQIEDGEANLDTLIPLLDEAMVAYKNCKAKIAAVESLLNDRLGTEDKHS